MIGTGNCTHIFWHVVTSTLKKYFKVVGCRKHKFFVMADFASQLLKLQNTAQHVRKRKLDEVSIKDEAEGDVLKLMERKRKELQGFELDFLCIGAQV